MTSIESLTRDVEFGTNGNVAFASEETIHQIEMSLGITFPMAYREFLKKHNGGSFIECIFNDDTIGPLVVVEFYPATATEGSNVSSAMKNLREFLPSRSIPFADDPGGNVFYIDTIQSESIFFWDHETRVRTYLTSGFEKFIESLTPDV